MVKKKTAGKGRGTNQRSRSRKRSPVAATNSLVESESPPSSFFDLSEMLTGFSGLDLLGTGVAQEYYDELLRGAGQEHVGQLLDAAARAGNSTTAVRKTIWDDDRFGPMARNIVLMWYLGSWYPLPESWHERYRPDGDAVDEHVVSATAYQEALVWPAIGAHPRGAKPPGFGSWGREPNIGMREAGRSRKK